MRAFSFLTGMKKSRLAGLFLDYFRLLIEKLQKHLVV